MKQVQCNFPGCTYQIPFPNKYCDKHETVQILCTLCGNVFARTRVLYNALVKAAKKRGTKPAFFCGKSCSAQRKKPGRIRGKTGSYNTKNEPIERLNLIFDKPERTHNRQQGGLRPRNWVSWGKGYELTEDLLSPVADPYHVCKSLLAKTLTMGIEEMDALTNRINDPEYQQRARWVPLYDNLFEQI